MCDSAVQGEGRCVATEKVRIKGARISRWGSSAEKKDHNSHRINLIKIHVSNEHAVSTQCAVT